MQRAYVSVLKNYDQKHLIAGPLINELLIGYIMWTKPLKSSIQRKSGNMKGYHEVNFVRSKDMYQTFPGHPISIYFWLK